MNEKLFTPYFETSAKEGDNVQQIFNKIAEMIYHFKTRR